MSVPPPVLLIAAETGEREGLAEMLERRGHTVTRLEQAAAGPRAPSTSSQTPTSSSSSISPVPRRCVSCVRASFAPTSRSSASPIDASRTRRRRRCGSASPIRRPARPRRGTRAPPSPMPASSRTRRPNRGPSRRRRWNCRPAACSARRRPSARCWPWCAASPRAAATCSCWASAGPAANRWRGPSTVRARAASVRS